MRNRYILFFLPLIFPAISLRHNKSPFVSAAPIDFIAPPALLLFDLLPFGLLPLDLLSLPNIFSLPDIFSLPVLLPFVLMFDDSPLFLNMFLIISRFVLLDGSGAADQMDEILFVSDGFVAFGAGLGSGLALREMHGVSLDGDVEFAVLAVFGFFGAVVGVAGELRGGEGALAVGTVLLLVVFLLMLFLEVDVVELPAGGTAFDVPAAVGEMSPNFAFRELLLTVIATFFGFFHPVQKGFASSNMRCIYIELLEGNPQRRSKISTKIAMTKNTFFTVSLNTYLLPSSSGQHSQWSSPRSLTFIRAGLKGLRLFPDLFRYKTIRYYQYLQQLILMFPYAEEMENHRRSYTRLTRKQLSQLYDLDHSQLLGEGSYGAVYKVTNAHGNEVALKHFNKKAIKQVRQIIREVENLRLLEHSNIARFYDCYLVDQIEYYVVIEYCPGGSLTDYLKERNLSDNEKIQICKDIAKGLTYAHEKRVIHRDLKPDNILIGKKGVAKICDFGCSTTLDSHEQGVMETQIGSPAYWDRPISMATGYDQTVDIYAMAMVFISIFKGKGIYDECQTKSEMEELRKKIDSNYDVAMNHLLQGVPDVVAKIIKCCMQTSSPQRYTAKEVVELLNNNSPKLSLLLSTVENEDIEDEISQFAVKLIAYYRRVDSLNNTLGSRRALLQLLRSSSEAMGKVELLSSLKYVQPRTKQQFMASIIFYYFFWLNSLKNFLSQSGPLSFSLKYPEIVPSAIEPDVMSTAQLHIKAEFQKYQLQFQRCCKNISRRLKLIDSKIYVPDMLKKSVGRVASRLEPNYDDFTEEQVKEQLKKFYQERMENQFKRAKGNNQDSASENDLGEIKILVHGFDIPMN